MKKNVYLLIVVLFLIIGCKQNELIKTHGIAYLDKREKLIIVNKSKNSKNRICDSIQTAFNIGNGYCTIEIKNGPGPAYHKKRQKKVKFSKKIFMIFASFKFPGGNHPKWFLLNPFKML